MKRLLLLITCITLTALPACDAGLSSDEVAETLFLISIAPFVIWPIITPLSITGAALTMFVVYKGAKKREIQEKRITVYVVLAGILSGIFFCIAGIFIGVITSL